MRENHDRFAINESFLFVLSKIFFIVEYFIIENDSFIGVSSNMYQVVADYRWGERDLSPLRLLNKLNQLRYYK